MADVPSTWRLGEARRLVRDGGAVAVAEEALRRVARASVAEAWIAVTPQAVLLEQAERVDALLAAGAELPLAGVPFAVKDNIDVVGFPTTAGCPEFALVPEASAPVVQRLLDAGALCLGKTNLDQFATGLVGTRSPAYGACANPLVPEYVAGGSSSGSAVAVATGEVVFSLGTDTAGSGRVPAANCGIVGLKPSLGDLPTIGVVPAMPSFDAVSVFAGSVSDAAAVFAVARTSRRRAAPEGARRRIGVVAHDWLGDDDARSCFEAALARVRAFGHEIVDVDGRLLAEAGALVYESALVAERVQAFGAFVAAHEEAVHPATRTILDRARTYEVADILGAHAELAELRERAVRLWVEVDVLVAPTVVRVPTMEEAKRDWFTPSAELGRTTAFVNPLRMCALAVPAGIRSSGVPFGISFVGPDGADDDLLALAAQFAGEAATRGGGTRVDDGAIPAGSAAGAEASRLSIAVVGAHLRGQPLHHQLTDRGATFVASTATSPAYRLYALDTAPPKPGLVRVDDDGVAVEVEVWSLDASAFGSFVAAIPAPLGVGKVELADGSEVTGFLCEPVAISGARDISEFGAWRAYLAAR